MKLPSKSMIERLGWATTAHATTQGMRFISNLVLTRLLSPEVFGIMLIVNTLRTGAELLSDIGIGQNIIASPNGEKREFLNTAWTLQLIRGVVLGLAIAICAAPLAKIYQNDLLAKILPLSAGLTVVFGSESINRFVAQRQQRLARITIFEISNSVISSLIYILFAWNMPNIWGLVYANVVATVVQAILSFVFFPDRNLKFKLDYSHALDILSFGKWIFLSTTIYFIATNFDRIYLGTAISLTLLGVFGLARSLIDVMSSFISRVGNYIVFPAVAGSRDNIDLLRQKLAHIRFPMLVIAASGISVFVALSDVLVRILYDHRYQYAEYMLPILALGVWFTTLTTTSEAVLLGLGRPIFGAAGNFAKLIWLVIALPLVVPNYGIMGGVIVIALADAVRYLPIWLAQRSEGLSFARQDLGVTVLMFAMIGLWREILHLAGLTSSWLGWWSMAKSLMV